LAGGFNAEAAKNAKGRREYLTAENAVCSHEPLALATGCGGDIVDRSEQRKQRLGLVAGSVASIVSCSNIFYRVWRQNKKATSIPGILKDQTPLA
jgi:hypothetical protein